MARTLRAIAPPAEERTFAEDVVFGLSSTPKNLPCKYFYDARGSALFDRITELDEYYPTRTEAGIMRAQAAAIAKTIGPGALIIELGSGSSIKTRLLLDELERPAGYVPVDISVEHLEAAAASIARDYPAIEVMPVAGDFTQGFSIPTPSQPAARCVVYFPGSTIGNLTHDLALALLTAIAQFVGAQGDERSGGLLLGFDLVKSPETLVAAYDDGCGVTSEFNLNLLTRINTELGGNFELDGFRHRAIWAPEPSRMEIFIRSEREQTVEAAGQRFHFAAGEDILTEYSHKYTHTSIRELARAAGFDRETLWTDADELFSVGLFKLPNLDESPV